VIELATALSKMLLSALGAGVGVTVVFSLAVLGGARFADARRTDRSVAASIYGVLTLLAIAVCAATVVYGVILVDHKT
jgi:hypothetical protein